MIHSTGSPGRPELDELIGALCAELGMDPALGRAMVVDERVRRLDRGADGVALGCSLAAAVCRRGEHGAEAAIGTWLVAGGGDDIDAVRAGWLVRLAGLAHALDAASAANDAPGADGAVGAIEAAPSDAVGNAAGRLRDAAIEAYEALDEQTSRAELSAAARRAILDPVVAHLARSEVALGRPTSAAVGDLERRRSARRLALPGTTLLDKHGDAIREIVRRDGRDWWLERFVEKFGVEPPADWWVDDPEAPAGGRVSPVHLADQWFDRADEAAFAEAMETRFRIEAELPLRGAGRISQPHLRHCLAAVLPDVPIVEEASPEWLGRQRLDLFVPSLCLAIEYQGEQHYAALAHWGGEDGLAARRELDERKRDACARAGVRLLEWRYDEAVSVAAVRRRLERAGILEPD